MSEPSIYKDNLSTFSIVSKDTAHNVSMINDMTIPVYNFDGIKDGYSKICLNHKTPHTHNNSQTHFIPHSCDALYVDDNQIVFIEFKNGKVDRQNIIRKLYDSLMILFDKGMGLQWRRKDYEANISYSRMNISFILVCRRERIPSRIIHGHLARRADLGLGVLRGYLFHDVKVYPPEEFEHYFLEQCHTNP